MRAKIFVTIAVIIPAAAGVVPGTVVPAQAQSQQSAKTVSVETRLRMLEDREEIRRLMIEYGRTLDQRDFNAFSKLFAQDAEYGGGGGSGITKGPEAIAKLLESIFKENPTGLKSPNFHLFCNETIQVKGDEAIAVSKGIFVAPGDGNRPEAVMLATYRDVFVCENGIWKFKKRIVQSDIPATQTPEK